MGSTVGTEKPVRVAEGWANEEVWSPGLGPVTPLPLGAGLELLAAGTKIGTGGRPKGVKKCAGERPFVSPSPPLSGRSCFPSCCFFLFSSAES